MFGEGGICNLKVRNISTVCFLMKLDSDVRVRISSGAHLKDTQVLRKC